jgi:uncharacterized protein (DUF302 family)
VFWSCSRSVLGRTGGQANFYINNCGEEIRDDKKNRDRAVQPDHFQAVCVVAGVNTAIGHPDMAEFVRSTHEARSFAELKSAVEKGLSKAGLMLFMQLDHGAVVRKETGRDTPRIVRFIIGNPLIMKEMAEHVPDAGSYAPVTVLVDERPDGVHLSYDRMASFLAVYGNPDALQVAEDLDNKVETLLRAATA